MSLGCLALSPRSVFERHLANVPQRCSEGSVAPARHRHFRGERPAGRRRHGDGALSSVLRGGAQDGVQAQVVDLAEKVGGCDKGGGSGLS
jgi:hypothetical protein